MVESILAELRLVEQYKWSAEARRAYVAEYIKTKVPSWLRDAPELVDFVAKLK